MKKLQVFENKCLRLAINFRRTPDNYKYISNKVLHEKTKTPMLNSFLFKLAKNFLSKTSQSENDLIRKFGNFSDEYIQTKKYKPPHALLSRAFNSKLLS